MMLFGFSPKLSAILSVQQETMLKSSAHIVAKNSLMMILNYFLSAKASSVKPTPRIHLNRMAISSATTAPSVRLLAACFTYTTFP